MWKTRNSMWTRSKQAPPRIRYIPYQYPHPLQAAGGDPSPPDAPSNLRISQ